MDTVIKQFLLCQLVSEEQLHNYLKVGEDYTLKVLAAFCSPSPAHKHPVTVSMVRVIDPESNNALFKV